jgi:hypothetical protein
MRDTALPRLGLPSERQTTAGVAELSFEFALLHPVLHSSLSQSRNRIQNRRPNLLSARQLHPSEAA